MEKSVGLLYSHSLNKHLLNTDWMNAKHSSHPWRYSSEQKRQNPFPCGADILVKGNGK